MVQKSYGRISLQVLLFLWAWIFLLPSGTLGQATLQTHYHRQNRGSSECLGMALYKQNRLAELGTS